MGKSAGFLLAVAAAGAITWATHAGLFFQTGKQWFDACWTKVHAERKPLTPEEGIAWSQCDPVAESSTYLSGFVFGGDPDRTITEPARAIDRACPSNWTDVPVGGFVWFVISVIEKRGGPQFIDRSTPPKQMIERALLERWPDCPKVRAANGYPKIVKQGDKWDFEELCKPCKAEKAAQKEKEEQAKRERIDELEREIERRRALKGKDVKPWELDWGKDGQNSPEGSK